MGKALKVVKAFCQEECVHFIDDSCLTVELECEKKRDDIRVHVTVPSELRLTADRRQFQRVMENLLRNELRYAQQHHY